MRAFLNMCDLCKADGEWTPAVAQYEGEGGRRFDACEGHVEEVKGFGLEIVLEYKFTGNCDPAE